jgi:hypothetical protein
LSPNIIKWLEKDFGLDVIAEKFLSKILCDEPVEEGYKIKFQ